MQKIRNRKVLAVLTLVGAIAIYLATPSTTKAQTADQFTPGMLFGPVWLNDGQHIELCASNLGEGDISAVIHFRNISTGEVTANQEVSFKQGGGDCAFYQGAGRVVGMARGEGRASDWVSPSNALISTMSVVDDEGGAKTRVTVLGTAKLWLRGL